MMCDKPMWSEPNGTGPEDGNIQTGGLQRASLWVIHMAAPPVTPTPSVSSMKPPPLAEITF